MITALRVTFGPAHVRKLAAGVALFAVTLAIATGPALAAAPAVFRNIPTTLPGNVDSVGYEATNTSELGDLIQLATGGARARANLPVTVVMSSWGCERGGNDTCVTTPGATWDQALTLTLYAVDDTGATPAAVTPSILQTTQTFAIPYRPSFDPTGPCAKTGTGWYSAAEDHCYSGFAYPVTFTLPAGADLPDKLIWGIAFNTSHHGYVPLGDDPNNALNNPWDSLNVGIHTFSGQPSVGIDIEPDNAFITGTPGTFRDDVGGWAAYAPLACFGYCPINLAAAPTSPPSTSPPTTPPTLAPTTPPTTPPTLAPTAAPTAATTPIESFAGATAAASASAGATPVEVVAAATGTPHSATPPPTNSNSPSDGGSSGLLALLISLGFGAVGLFAVGAQRRTMRR